MWCAKKNGEQAIGKSKGGLTTKIHMMAANATKAVDFILSAEQFHDAPQGRVLMETVGKQETVTPLFMDRAYEDDETRYIAQMLNFYPVVPPKLNRADPWVYDKELYISVAMKSNDYFALFKVSAECFAGLTNSTSFMLVLFNWL